MAIALTRSRPRRLLRRRAFVALGVFLAIVLSFLWFVGILGGNVRTVEPGRFYRSAQLSGSALEDVLGRFGIRSVVNLRGASDKGFYRSEMEVSRKMGVAHFDVSMSAYRLPRPQELQALLAAFDAAPRPILVHCQQGADRSGLASTIYENVYEGVPFDQAEHEQLTWRYGHFGFVGTWRLDRFLDLYRTTANGQNLREWIVESYPAIYARETEKR